MIRAGIFLGYFFSAVSGWATPLPTGDFEGGAIWLLPGNEKGVRIEPGASVTQKIEVPPLSSKEAGVPGAWRGILTIDGFGTVGGSAGGLTVEAIDPATGEVLVQGKAMIKGGAPKANWAVVTSSEQGGSLAEAAFDGNPGTDWHSRYGANQPKPPHWIGVMLGEPEVIRGVRYLPRQGGFTNGVAKEYRVEILRPGEGWVTIKKGSSKPVVAKERKALEVLFEKPEMVEGFRFVVESDWSGGGFGTAAEVSAIGLDLPERDGPVAAGSRVWLEIPAGLMKMLEGKTFGLRLRSSGGDAVVVGATRFCRIHEAPSRKLFGRSNGGLGPDKLGAGLLGFDALVEHRQVLCSVMKVRKGSPADSAGLKPGDAIVSVDGVPLPENDLAPGWDWFHRSHEAVLGRAGEAALAAGKRSLDLGVLREGRIVILKLGLPRTAEFTTMNPVSDPQAAALLKDMLAWILKNQREDGSWSGDSIRTCFSSLALLATGEKEHEARVRRAIDWALAKYPEPEKYGNLGFWAGGYTGLLYGEWFLRTGDERVLPHLEKLRDWAVEGQHTSKWGIPALGHGPSGLPYDFKALVAPACHLLVFEAVAQRCGMESGIWEMLTPYMEKSWANPAEGGNGSLGYNPSYKDDAEFWFRSGSYAMACELRGERQEVRDAIGKYMQARHPWIRNSHAYGEPGGAWGLLGLQMIKPEIYAEVMGQYGWWFSLAWEPGYGLRFTTPHMGAPYMGEDDLINAAYALVLQAPRRNLAITGLPAKADPD